MRAAIGRPPSLQTNLRIVIGMKRHRTSGMPQTTSPAAGWKSKPNSGPERRGRRSLLQGGRAWKPVPAGSREIDYPERMQRLLYSSAPRRRLCHSEPQRRILFFFGFADSLGGHRPPAAVYPIGCVLVGSGALAAPPLPELPGRMYSRRGSRRVAPDRTSCL